MSPRAEPAGMQDAGPARSSAAPTRRDRRPPGEEGRALVVTPRLLRRWPLPRPDAAGDKEGRGRVLVVGGAPEMPGAVILAATAALRAGAGKLRIATCASIAQHVATAVPEALVAGLPETAGGAIDPAAAARIAELANQTQGALVGPGMVDEVAVSRLIGELVPRLAGTTLVLDAAALAALRDAPRLLHRLDGNAVLTPHAGEMASMLGLEKDAVAADPQATARRAAQELRAVVALKGADTFIATPTGDTYRNRTGNIGLATSGSGDTLSG